MSAAAAVLPGPAPKQNDKFPSNKTYYEIPIAVQDRSFNDDGSLFYPDSREFFDEIVGDYIPAGEFSPIWNPEFFGNMLIANGATWPYQVVEQRRYRFRFLNGCQSRFLILDFCAIPGVEVWQIGNEGGFLAAPVDVTGDHGGRHPPRAAERADVDRRLHERAGRRARAAQRRPRRPLRRRHPRRRLRPPTRTRPGRCCSSASSRRRRPTRRRRRSSSSLPAVTPLPPESVTRPLVLVEKSGVGFDANGDPVEGPVEALLGTADGGVPVEHEWEDPSPRTRRSGRPRSGSSSTPPADAHPMHVHEVAFEVVDREGLVRDPEDPDDIVVPFQPDGDVSGPEPWETRVQGHRDRLSGAGHARRATFVTRASSSGTATSSSTRTTR